MAACGSLQHIFESPLPESPRLLESLSPWKGIKNMKPVSNCTFTDIFGEQLHYKENHHVLSESSPSFSPSSPLLPPPESSPSSPSSSPSLSFVELSQQDDGIEGIERVENISNRGKSPTSSYCCPSAPQKKQHYKHSDSFSSMNFESLSLCTEGLGFESSDDVEDLGNDSSFDHLHQSDSEKNTCFSRYSHSHQESSFWKESKRSRTNKGTFPPPISCIGRTGKPWFCFRSYRQDGRFILQEIRFPIQEFLHACREDGRLKLQYIQSDDEIFEGDEEDEEEEGEEYDDDDDGDTSFDAVEDVNKENMGDVFDENHDQIHHQEDADTDDGFVQISNNNNVQDSSE